MTPRILLLILLTTLGTRAAAAGKCNEAHLKTNRYYGAMRASLKASAVTITAVEKALNSDQPYDPLANVAPAPHQTAAKHLFAQLIKDPEISAQWKETKVLLAKLIGDEQAQDQIRGAAETATKTVLAPHKILTFEGGNDQDGYAFTRLPDGRDVFAHLTGDPRRELVVTTVKGHDIFHLPLPAPAPLAGFWKLRWHLDGKGELWLYLCIGDTREGKKDLYCFRLKWGTTEFIPIFSGDRSAIPMHLRSISPDHMVLFTIDWERLDITGDEIKKIYGQIFPGPQSTALNREGKLVTRENSGLDGAEIVFTTKKGDTYIFAGHGNSLGFWQVGVQGTSRALPISTGPSQQLLAHETETGRLLLAQISEARPRGRNGLVRVFAPLESFEPIYEMEFENFTGKPNLHWMSGPRGELLLGLTGQNTVYFAQPLVPSQGLARVPFSGNFGDWCSAGEKTYFYVRAGVQQMLYDIESEVPR